MDKKEKIIKSNQEQAVASWINYLNQVRLEQFREVLKQENSNLNEAYKSINEALETIKNDIIYNGKGRGGERGMHGFIAEIAEYGIENARNQVEGKLPVCKWIDDNGPADLQRGATLIQQKFVNSGNHLSLQAIKNHLETYPDYLQNGGKYQIPKDHYEKIKWLLSIPEEEAQKMPTGTGVFSLRQWREVHEFFASDTVPMDSIEPSVLKYKEVQRNTYENRLSIEKKDLKKTHDERCKQAYIDNAPTLKEGAKATVVSAALEGGTALYTAIMRKRKAGKTFNDFNQEDWREIADDSGSGLLKGGFRGSSIYMLTNYTATPAAVANALVTASFGVAQQAYLLRNGELDELHFIENSESVCLDATISALSSVVGQVVIPVPVLGAIIGNTTGTIMLQIAKGGLSEHEQKLVEEYLNSINKLNEQLDKEYQEYLVELSKGMEYFTALIRDAFVLDVHMAFATSIKLAERMEVPADEVLDSQGKIDEYFFN